METNDLYPTIPKRMKASLFDLAVLLITICFIMFIYSQSGVESPVIGIIVMLTYLFYEPLFVTLRGQTPGHSLYGFRVVDSVNLDNPNFIKATARFFVKLLLGIFSLAWALFSNRQQSLHDIVTKSVVVSCQVELDDFREQGLPQHSFAQDQPDLVLPSKKRRIAFILIWWLMVDLVASLGLNMILYIACTNAYVSHSLCRYPEKLYELAFALVFICIVVLGAQGKLPGARSKRRCTTQPKPGDQWQVD